MATATAPKKTSPSDRTEQASAVAEDVLQQLQNGGQQAISAVRRFLDNVDESLAGSNSPSFVHDIADSALEMSDKMVEYGGEALRGIAGSARKAA